MRQLTEEQWQEFLTLIRTYARLRADNGLFLGMLLKSQTDQEPIQDWYGDLKKLRQLPAYVAQLEEIEQLISRADALTPDDDLTELIAKLRPPDFQH
jgi:hypothetical protein